MTGIVNNLIMQMLLAEVVAEMIRSGSVPATMQGSMMGPGAIAYNEGMQSIARERGF